MCSLIKDLHQACLHLQAGLLSSWTLLACLLPSCVCRLIKDFEQEARTDGMPPAELATRKKGLVQQLNDFIAMKKERGASITAKQELIGTKKGPAVKDVNGERLEDQPGKEAGKQTGCMGWLEHRTAWRGLPTFVVRALRKVFTAKHSCTKSEKQPTVHKPTVRLGPCCDACSAPLTGWSGATNQALKVC